MLCASCGEACFELKCTFVPVTCNTPLISGIHKHALCLIDPVASVKTGKVAFLLSSMRCTVFTKCLSEFPTYNVQVVNLEKWLKIIECYYSL